MVPGSLATVVSILEQYAMGEAQETRAQEQAAGATAKADK